MAAPAATNMDALFSYVSRSGTGGGWIGQSGSPHHFLGLSADGQASADITAAIAGRA